MKELLTERCLFLVTPSQKAKTKRLDASGVNVSQMFRNFLDDFPEPQQKVLKK